VGSSLAFVALASFLGGITVALLGWLEASSPWNWKKFSSSVVRSLVGAVVITVATDYSGAATPIIYLIAFLSGAGVEVGGNRIAGAISKK